MCRNPSTKLTLYNSMLQYAFIKINFSKNIWWLSKMFFCVSNFVLNAISVNVVLLRISISRDALVTDLWVFFYVELVRSFTIFHASRVWMVRFASSSRLTKFFFVEKIELNVIAAGFGIFSSNEFYSSNGKALGWLVFFQLDLERGASNDVATTDDVCSISRKVKLILWLFAIKWHLHSSEHRRLLVLSQFSLLTLRPVDRSSSPVFNVRPWLYTTMIRTYVLKHRQFASCLYYYLQTSTLLEEYWCAFVCVCLYRSKV